ncbi:hypothetical protein BpHYR1_053745 [Brachionus plicatilis]|uniref:Uncharacterized protein n=1 Tax=Brachionus plicatilis TaxID=10195 RepID=A0A3M7PNZ1_BRAPC|nr:hypothetical protein BpHYR1_053745 [Brachionus plicatilis]
MFKKSTVKFPFFLFGCFYIIANITAQSLIQKLTHDSSYNNNNNNNRGDFRRTDWKRATSFQPPFDIISTVNLNYFIQFKFLIVEKSDF